MFNDAMTGPGHVFVVQADLTKLSCDHFLIPADVVGDVGSQWAAFNPRPDSIRQAFADGSRVTPSEPFLDSATVRWVDTGSSEKFGCVDWLIAGVRQALEAVAQDVAISPAARHGRARPLVGMPVFGTGAGGFAARRGAVLDCLLTMTREIAQTAAFDIVIACYNRADYSALQSRKPRQDDVAATLSDDQRKLADHLGLLARTGALVLFLGAGISMPAGLPSWPELLKRICDEAALAPDALPDVAELSNSSAAEQLMRAASRLRETVGEHRFLELLTDILRRSEHALGHALLASMRVQDVITTNFDELYEAAAVVPFYPQELQVMPWTRVRPGAPWLLKLHGGLQGKVVLTKEDYTSDTERRPLESIVQALLMTRHMLFVGYSMSDEDFVELADGVGRLLTSMPGIHRDSERRIGTVLAVDSQPRLDRWKSDFCVCDLGDGPDYTPESGRRLEIFLDRVAAQGASDEHSWVLDDRYRELLGENDRQVVSQLAAIDAGIPDDDPTWRGLKSLLHNYGATTE